MSESEGRRDSHSGEKVAPGGATHGSVPRYWGHHGCARRSWRDPTGASPVRVRHSEPPVTSVAGGGVRSDTMIAWDVGLSHESLVVDIATNWVSSRFGFGNAAARR